MHKRASFLVCLICLIILQALTFAVSQTANDMAPYIISLALMPSIIVLIAIFMTGSRDFFSPLYVFFYLVFIGVFLKSVYLLYFDSGLARDIILAGRGNEILENGIVAISIGALAFVIGFLLLRRVPTIGLDHNRVKCVNSGIREKYINAILIFTLALSSLGFVYFYIEMDIGASISQGKIAVKRTHEATSELAPRGAALTYLRWVGQTLPQVVVLVMITLSHATKTQLSFSQKILVLLIGLLSIGIPVLSSARLELAYFFVMAIMVHHYYKRRARLTWILATGVIILLFLGLLGQIRHMQTTSSPTIEDKIVQFDEIVEKTLGRAYFIDVGKTSVIVDSVPKDVEYLWGRSFLTFIFAPIPRTLWETKPIVRIGHFVGTVIYQRPNESGVPPGLIGELYLNFGYVGIIVGMLILGLVLRIIYENHVKSAKGLLSQLWYIIWAIVLLFTLLSSDFVGAFSQAVRYGVPLLLIGAVLNPKVRVRAIR